MAAKEGKKDAAKKDAAAGKKDESKKEEKKTWMEERQEKFKPYPSLIENIQKMVFISAILFLTFAIVASVWYPNSKFPIQIWGYCSTLHIIGIFSSLLAFRTGASIFFIIAWALYLVWCLALIIVILAFVAVTEWRQEWQVDVQLELHVGWFLYGTLGLVLFILYTLFLRKIGLLNFSQLDADGKDSKDKTKEKEKEKENKEKEKKSEKEKDKKAEKAE